MPTSSSHSRTSTWCISVSPRCCARPIESRIPQDVGAGDALDTSVSERRIYVYALLESPMVLPRRLRATIDVMPVAGLFAAVERVAEPTPLSEDALRRQHDIVVSLHEATDAILPVRFGALLDIDELAEVVRLRRPVLTQALERVRGHEQMTIRIFGQRAGGKRPAAASSGKDYLRQRATSARPVLSEPGKRLVRAVSSLAAAESIDTGRGGVEVTIHHLIRRGDGDRYRRLVMARATTQKPAPDHVVTGPWPPFAFAPDIWSSDSERPARGRR